MDSGGLTCIPRKVMEASRCLFRKSVSLCFPSHLVQGSFLRSFSCLGVGVSNGRRDLHQVTCLCNIPAQMLSHTLPVRLHLLYGKSS